MVIVHVLGKYVFRKVGDEVVLLWFPILGYSVSGV
jgi:hypothetical protein